MCLALRLLMRLVLTAHNRPLDTYLRTSFKEGILIIVYLQQDFPCAGLKSHEKLCIIFYKVRAKGRRKDAPVLCKCPVAKEESAQGRHTHSGRF